MRFLLAFLAAVALAAAVASAPPAAVARSKPAPASPSPSASPSSEATSTPEPADVAIPRLQAELKKNPKDRDALMELAGYYIQVGRPDLGLQAVQQLEQLGVKTGQVYYLAGYANMQLGQMSAAISDLENASNLEPTNMPVLSMLADAYVRQNRLADADRVAKRAITFNKNERGAYETYGGVLEAEGKFDEARAQFEIAAKMDPKDVQPILLEARSYVKQNAIALASDLFDRALAIDPKNLDALSGKAQVLAQEHNVPEAIQAYEKLRALVATPNEKASVLADEAHLYAVEKMDDQAVATYKSAIQQYGGVLDTHVAYGDYLAAKNNLTEAVSQWEAGLGPNRDNRDALGRLGTYYAEQKQYPKAQEYLKRLTDLSPNDPRGWGILGGVYAEQNDWKDARDSFKRAYDLTHAPDALKAVGQTDLSLHNYKEAQQIFEAIEKQGGDYVKQDPSVIFMLGQSYQKQGMKPQAKSAYQRFLAYLKPGTQAYTQVKKMIDDIDRPDKSDKPDQKKK